MRRKWAKKQVRYRIFKPYTSPVYCCNFLEYTLNILAKYTSGSGIGCPFPFVSLRSCWAYLCCMRLQSSGYIDLKRFLNSCILALSAIAANTAVTFSSFLTTTLCAIDFTSFLCLRVYHIICSASTVYASAPPPAGRLRHLRKRCIRSASAPFPQVLLPILLPVSV